VPGTPHLDQRSHVGKVGVHGSSVGEVLIHPLHKLSETAESQSLCAGKRQSLLGCRDTATPAAGPSLPAPHAVRGTQRGLAAERQLTLHKVHAVPRLGSWESDSMEDKRDPATRCSTAQDPAKGHHQPSRSPHEDLGTAEQSHPLTVIQDDQERGQQVTHPLHVADLDVLPDVAV